MKRLARRLSGTRLRRARYFRRRRSHLECLFSEENGDASAQHPQALTRTPFLEALPLHARERLLHIAVASGFVRQ